MASTEFDSYEPQVKQTKWQGTITPSMLISNVALSEVAKMLSTGETVAVEAKAQLMKEVETDFIRAQSLSLFDTAPTAAGINTIPLYVNDTPALTASVMGIPTNIKEDMQDLYPWRNLAVVASATDSAATNIVKLAGLLAACSYNDQKMPDLIQVSKEVHDMLQAYQASAFRTFESAKINVSKDAKGNLMFQNVRVCYEPYLNVQSGHAYILSMDSLRTLFFGSDKMSKRSVMALGGAFDAQQFYTLWNVAALSRLSQGVFILN